MKLSQKSIKVLKKFGIEASKIALTAAIILNLIAGNEINLTSKNINIASDRFNVDKYGNVTINANGDQAFKIMRNNQTSYMVYMTEQAVGINYEGYNMTLFAGGEYTDGSIMNSMDIFDAKGYTSVRGEGIKTPTVTQTSKESEKKNFEKLDNGLDIINNIDIYKYNLKNEEDTTKKHIGFIIGENYNYSKAVTNNENDGVDIYSFVAVCCKSIQEQQEQIENQNNLIQELIKRIEKLEGGNNE